MRGERDELDLEGFLLKGPLRDRLVASVVTITVLTPFVAKPFHIDDPLFLWTARRIHEAPLDFYGFLVNWYDTAQPMSEVMKNPPLVAYWYAGIAMITGFGEIALHLGALPFSVAAVLGTHELARRLCARPLLATLVFASTPTFLVSATSLGADVPMLAAWVWAVVLWVRGLDEGRASWLAAAAVLCALAALAKYFGASLLPLLLVYTLVRERRISRHLAWLVVPALALALYEAATAAAYGQGLLESAVGYARQTSASAITSPGPVWQRALVALLFTGGSVVTPGLLAALSGSRSSLALLVFAAAACALLAVTHGSLGSLPLVDAGHVRWRAALHVACFALLGLELLALGTKDLFSRRDADALLLALALAGTLAFGAFFNWTVNARSLIVAAPVAAILAVRALGTSAADSLPRRAIPGIALALGWCLGLAVTWSDARLAATFRRATTELLPSGCATSNRCGFLGHWGLQYYARERGAWPVDLQTGSLAVGDLLLVPENSAGSNEVPWGAATLVRSYDEVPLEGISVQSIATRAAFHAAVRGPLPFVLGEAAPERFVLVRIDRPLEAAAGELRPVP